MPFTPFHFGLGYAGAGIRPFSFLAFAVTQVVIDCETAWNMATGAPRLHTFFHTFAGSLVAAALGGLATRLLMLVPMPSILVQWRLWDRSVSLAGLALSCWFGAWSHVLLDAIMHSDARPFAPFSDAVFLHGLIPLPWLHAGLLALFVPGLWAVARAPTSFPRP